VPPAAEVPRTLRLHAARSGAVLSLALVSLTVGFAQFGAVASLGEVARAFGHPTGGTTIAEEAGLSGTELGIGLAILRLASLGALASTAAADRYGRRRCLLGSAAAGLACTAAVALSPSYWSFVAIYALGRPLLSSASALAQVMAAEQTAASDRALAIALVSGGYGLGAGVSALAHTLLGGGAGFRALFALALVPLVLLWPLRRAVSEPDRFALVAPRLSRHLVATLGPAYRRRLLVVLVLAFSIAFMAGPVNSFVYLYGENILGLPSGEIAAFVLGAGVAGLCGLLLGQHLADRIGRRPTGAGALVAMAGCAVATYSGSELGLGLGYVLGIGAASVLAPAVGALGNEVFPTAVRASVAGWLVAASVLGAVAGLLLFGAVADAGRAFVTVPWWSPRSPRRRGCCSSRSPRAPASSPRSSSPGRELRPPRCPRRATGGGRDAAAPRRPPSRARCRW